MSCMYIQPTDKMFAQSGGFLSDHFCMICDSQFKKNSGSSVCSLKCRIIAGSQKKENGCWIWKGSVAGDYGKVRWNSKTISAHRASYLSFHGPILAPLNVCHACDEPLCANPDHLWVGTQKENKQDAKRKKRDLRGEKNHFHKFTDLQIDEMRKLKKEGFSYSRLKRIFNCSVIHIFNVIKNKVR